MARARNPSLDHLLVAFGDAQSLMQRAPVRVQENGLIETGLGFFRIAWSPETRTAALFYSRNPDNLATADDGESIEHKGAAHLVAMRSLPETKGAGGFGHSHAELDLNWVLAEIHWLHQELPRAALRETALHRLSENEYLSAFVAYRTEAWTEDKNQNWIEVASKSNKNRLFATPPAGRRKGSFAEAAQGITARTTSHFGLKVRDARQEDPAHPHGEVRDHFTKEETPEALLADFELRAAQIWHGQDPIFWKTEQPSLPFFRTADRLREAAEKTAESVRRGDLDWVQPLQAALRFGPVAFAIEMLVDRGIKTGQKLLRRTRDPRLKDAHPVWRQFIKTPNLELMTVEADLHQLLGQTDAGAYRDLRWLDPVRDRASLENIGLPARRDPERDFARWLRSQYLSPFGGLFDYAGLKGQTVDRLSGLSDVRVIHQRATNGLQFFHVPETRMLYAVYVPSQFADFHRHVPLSMERFLEDRGAAWAINLASPAPKLQKLKSTQILPEVGKAMQLSAGEVSRRFELPPLGIQPYVPKNPCAEKAAEARL